VDSHTGTWSLGPTDTADLIFVSSRPASVLITIQWTRGSTSQINKIAIYVDGVPPPNSNLGGGDSDFSRTFLFDSASTISVNLISPTSLSTQVSGAYQVSIA
jgi:hypothetical protein